MTQSALNTLVAPTRTPVDDSLAKTKGVDNSVDNRDKSVWWWLAFFLVFVGYGWLQNRNSKISEQLKPSNMSANLHNILFVTFAAVIGLVGGKILFIKLAAWTKNIPFLGTAMQYIADLFNAV